MRRLVVVLLVLVGVALTIVSGLADMVGAGSNPSAFGWKQALGLGVGIAAFATAVVVSWIGIRRTPASRTTTPADKGLSAASVQSLRTLASEAAGRAASRWSGALEAAGPRARTWLTQHRAPLLGLSGLFIFLVAANVWWLLTFRSGYPLDIDELGYMSQAFRDGAGLREGGLDGLWREFRERSTDAAPLLPLVTAPIVALVGPETLASFLVQSVFLGLLLASAYGIGERLAGRRVGFLTALVISTLPAVIDFSRTYHLVVPSTAVFTAAIYALLRSEGLSRRGWSVCFGALLGASVLARTMVWGFMPGLLAAVGLAVLAGPRGLGRRATNLLLALFAAILVAAPWYTKKAPAVYAYLTGSGYGQESVYYGERRSPLSVEFWTAEISSTITRELYLPLATVLTLAILGGLAALVRRVRREGVSRSFLAAAARHPALILVLVVLEGYLALTSSRNDGTGFPLPLLPAAVALATASVVWMPFRRLRLPLAGAFVVVAALNVAAKSDLLGALSRPRAVEVPVLGPLTVVDGTGVIQRYVAAAGYPLGPVSRPMPVLHREWLPTSANVRELLVAHADRRNQEPRYALASREPLFNTNSLGFFGLSAGQQLDPRVGGDTVEAYRVALSGPRSRKPNFLLASDRAPLEFPPPVTQAHAERAASSLGFRVLRRVKLPDGRELRIWWLGAPV